MCPQPKAMFFSLARQIEQPYTIVDVTSVLLGKLVMTKITFGHSILNFKSGRFVITSDM